MRGQVNAKNKCEGENGFRPRVCLMDATRLCLVKFDQASSKSLAGFLSASGGSKSNCKNHGGTNNPSQNGGQGFI